MLTTMWKSAHFRVRANFEPLSNELFIPLNFRSVGFRFLHTPIPSMHCNFLAIILPLTGAYRAYQVPLIIDTNELSALLYSDGYMGHYSVFLISTFPIHKVSLSITLAYLRITKITKVQQMFTHSHSFPSLIVQCDYVLY